MASCLVGSSAARISHTLRRSVRRLVLERSLGVGAQVLELVLALVLGLRGAGSHALVVGVVGHAAGLGAGLALGVGGLTALVGGGHFCGGFVFGWV